MLKYCDFCGQPFETPNIKRLYCCEAHTRAADNERRRDRRAEAAELAAMEREKPFPDVWELNDLGDEVTMGALLDGWTAQCEPDCPESLIGGPMACQSCPYWKSDANSKRKRKPGIDLLCDLCRSGGRV